MSSRQTICECWHEFTQETSMHGIRYVKTKGISLVRRVIWGITILGMLVYFGYAGHLFLDEYFKKSIKTRTTVRNSENLTFPTVTICNRNYWKHSWFENPTVPEQYSKLYQELMSDIYNPAMGVPLPTDKYNWSDPYVAAVATSEGDSSVTLRKVAHTLNDTFAGCFVNSIPQPCSNIFSQVKTDAGFCYQFNGDGSFVSHTAGLSGGIQLLMDTMTHEYYIGPSSMSEGFSVAIHDSDVVPLVSELSYGVSPGAHTNMVIQKKETRRVPPPADDNRADCLDTKKEANPLHHYSIYSRAACQYECVISHVLRSCGCVNFLHPSLNGSRTCNVKEMLFCVKPAEHEYLSQAKHLAACACKSSCKEIQYSAMLSAYKFPNRQYFRLTSAENLYDTIEYMKENYVVLNIHYGQMSYELLEEEIAYTIPDMIASIGGTLGVCIGASLLTLVEFVEFLVLTVFRAVNNCTRKNEKQTTVEPASRRVSVLDLEAGGHWARERFKPYQ